MSSEFQLLFVSDSLRRMFLMFLLLEVVSFFGLLDVF